jgi:hypothetical protein
MMPTKRQIADALQSNMRRVIQDMGVVLRTADGPNDVAWPIPSDYTLKLAVVWRENSYRIDRAVLRATVDGHTVETPVNLLFAHEIKSAYMELARDLWTAYVLQVHPEFCKRLRESASC